VHGAQPIRILLQMFPFSLFLARGSGKRERERTHNFFLFFPSKVYCHVIPHRVLFSYKKLERVVEEPDCFELP